ncbi:unnamed protein product [Linum tenue]|uniref:Uncharacterized protein n=1 Tax=Linum tenue TaxID=586396 RepID=A0AAV0LH15_9ROSI|nr:unnamed protein product [Linum tenue]
MDFPGGHNHHHQSHHRHNDDYNNDDERRSANFYPPPGTNAYPPQPAPYGHNEFGAGQHYPAPPSAAVNRHGEEAFYEAPPPPPKPHHEETTHVYHSSHESSHSHGGIGYDPTPNYPPPAATHESSYGGIGHAPPQNFPAQVTHVSHGVIGGLSHHSAGPVPGLDLTSKPSSKVYCKGNPDFHLTIRDGKLMLARSDPRDPCQNWFKDEKYSTRVKDAEGSPCFSLVNKGTGQAMKHSTGDSNPVQLVPYKPDVLDQSVLWSLSKDMGSGFRAMRMVNNIHLNVDAFHGDKQSGGVRDGTTIVLWQWNQGDNQLWKIVPQ